MKIYLHYEPSEYTLNFKIKNEYLKLDNLITHIKREFIKNYNSKFLDSNLNVGTINIVDER